MKISNYTGEEPTWRGRNITPETQLIRDLLESSANEKTMKTLAELSEAEVSKLPVKIRAEATGLGLSVSVKLIGPGTLVVKATRKTQPQTEEPLVAAIAPAAVFKAEEVKEEVKKPTPKPAPTPTARRTRK